MGADVSSLDGPIAELGTVGWKDRDAAKERLYQAASALIATSVPL